MSGQHGTADGKLHIILCRTGTLLIVRITVVDQLDDLCKANRTNDKRGKRNAAEQMHASKLIARSAGQSIHAHACKQNTKTGNDYTLDGIFSDQPADGCHGDQQDRCHLGRTKFQSQVCKAWSHKGQDKHADGATDAGGHVCG